MKAFSCLSILLVFHDANSRKRIQEAVHSTVHSYACSIKALVLAKRSASLVALPLLFLDRESRGKSFFDPLCYTVQYTISTLLPPPCHSIAGSRKRTELTVVVIVVLLEVYSI